MRSPYTRHEKVGTARCYNNTRAYHSNLPWLYGIRMTSRTVGKVPTQKTKATVHTAPRLNGHRLVQKECKTLYGVKNKGLKKGDRKLRP